MISMLEMIEHVASFGRKDDFRLTAEISDSQQWQQRIELLDSLIEELSVQLQALRDGGNDMFLHRVDTIRGEIRATTASGTLEESPLLSDKFFSDDWLDALNTLLADSYSFPPKPVDAIAQCMILRWFYSSWVHTIEVIPVEAIMRMDRSLAAISLIIGKATSGGFAKLDRINRSRNTVQKNKSDAQQKAIEEYFRVDERGNKKIGEICGIIKDQLGAKHKIKRSKATIRRYLKINGIF